MTTETSQNILTDDLKPLPFGMRLQSAREALGLECKDTASQLRLSEKVILMMETDCYSSDLPMTFVRGYLRSYGKLLHIPELEIKQAVEFLKPQPTSPGAALSLTPKPAPLLTSSHYFMQLFTYLIIFTLIGLVGTWWYTHTVTTPIVESQITLPDASATVLPTAAKTNLVAANTPDTKVTTTTTTPITSTTTSKNPATPATSTRATHHEDTEADDDDDDNDTNNTETKQ
jgi:cytoskeleton protein RodZ